MRRILKGLVLCFFSLSIGTAAMAQQGLELGGWLGGAFYFGDLNTQFDVTHPGAAGGLIARYNFNNRLAMKFSANYGFLRADDADANNAFELQRNINFRSHIGDLSGQFEFNFFRYVHGSPDYFYTPYLFAGVSMFAFNPYAIYDGEKTPPLRDLGTEGQFLGEEYSTFQRALNFGGGFKLDLSYEWSMNIEISIRKLFTDYLDDVSTVYANKGEIRGNHPAFGDLAVLASDPSFNGEVGIEGRQRGDATTKDNYVFFSVGLVYYFGNLKCPDISK